MPNCDLTAPEISTGDWRRPVAQVVAARPSCPQCSGPVSPS
ncbi:MAG: hypothetical protein WDN06_01810 [Asticcacaulis sp.]